VPFVRPLFDGTGGLSKSVSLTHYNDVSNRAFRNANGAAGPPLCVSKFSGQKCQDEKLSKIFERNVWSAQGYFLRRGERTNESFGGSENELLGILFAMRIF
jgi:hypothetical protein